MTKLTTEILNLATLRDAVPQSIFEAGESLVRWGRVEIDELTETIALVKVQDYKVFDVKISLSSSYLYLRCDCSYADNGKICKHDVAAFIAVRNRLVKGQVSGWEEQLRELIEPQEDGFFAPARSRRNPRGYLLFFSLHPAGQDFYSSTYGYSSWRIAPYQLPLSALPAQLRAPEILQDPSQLLPAIAETAGLSSQAKAVHDHLDSAGCRNGTHEILSLANILVDRNRAYTYYGVRFPLADYLALIGETGAPLFLGSANHPLQTALRVHPEPGLARLEASRTSDGIRIRPQVAFLTAAGDLGDAIPLAPGDVRQINNDPPWLLIGRDVVRLDNDDRLVSTVQVLNTPEIYIPVEQESYFLHTYYPNLVESLPLEGEIIRREHVDGEPVGRLYMTESNGKLQAELRFAYAGYEVSYEADYQATAVVPKPDSWDLIVVTRRPEAEETLFSSLSSSTYRLKRAPKPAPPGRFVLRANAHPVDFLMYSVPRLAQDGYEVYGEENLKSIRVSRARPTISFNVSSGIDWFDVQAVVKFGELEVSLKDLRRAFRKQQRFIKLADGSVGELPGEWLERYKHLFGLGEQTGEVVRLSDYHLTVIDQLLAGAERARTDPEFERRRRRLLDFGGIQSQSISRHFQGELRPYQKAGFDWLFFLHEFNFGGCLADDMGLGKTIQTLAFFQSLYERIADDPGNGAAPEAHAASLLVVPRSLLVNWQREAARFTPELRLLEYAAGDRPKDVRVFDRYDLVVTTYGIMRRDIERLRKYTFNYVVLDESQAIKNPVSQTSKSARLLRARHRLALTGTPVENSTVELWSLFAFLNPGLLGNFEYFKSEFAGPIERANADVEAAERAAGFLRKLVYPFILRRTKEKVAPELPPRTERVVYADMEPGQRKLYNRTRDLYRGLLLGMLESDGMQNSRMKILEGLLRLRQISLHPRLVESGYRGASGKFELLFDTLETLHSEGHKALVFSQFVQMLALVRAELENRRIPYAYLDGSTRDRQAVVDRFQADASLPFFLISLKAGGQGLNLTAADYVIHLDPWWNPAVEMQATDRTHRIGQDKPVFVYKLIARDSVEEKILQLQEQKKQLVEQIITTDESFFKSLTAEDVKALFT